MQIDYHQASFLLSCPSIASAPSDIGHEVIFAGRSNAGKSSCINTLTGQKKLAKVSKTPGRTQHLVFFELGNDNKLVDLPGYGFAKVPVAVKEKWNRDMSEYFAQRKALVGAVLIMDCRHPLKEFDKLMLEWSMHSELHTHILLTKADKLSKNNANKALFSVQQELPNVSVQLFSSHTKAGIDTLHTRLNQMFTPVE